MKYRGEATLPGGGKVVIRSLCAEDAEEAIRVGKRASGETEFLIRYEDEWFMTPEKQRRIIREAQYGAKSLLLGAFVDGQMAGMASILPPADVDRVRHRALLGILVLKRYWGIGIGTAMMHALIEMAKTTALEQIELEVVSENETAIRLYERFGFETFARHPRKLKYRDGRYADMMLMMLELKAN